MNANTQPDTTLLMGTWRLAKIQWHDKKVTHFNDPDKWQELTFKPDGTIEKRYKEKGEIRKEKTTEKWYEENGKIIVTAFGLEYFYIEMLKPTALVLKFLKADVREGLVRV